MARFAWVLLGLDGVVVCGWSDECALDRGDHGLWFLEKVLPVGAWSARLGWVAGISLIVSGVGVLVVA